jgi:hypothetical protein
METIIINLKSGGVKTITDVFKVIVSGNHLIITKKNTEESNGEHYLFTTNEIIDLKEIDNYTTKIKTKKYGND